MASYSLGYVNEWHHSKARRFQKVSHAAPQFDFPIAGFSPARTRIEQRINRVTGRAACLRQALAFDYRFDFIDRKLSSTCRDEVFAV